MFLSEVGALPAWKVLMAGLPLQAIFQHWEYLVRVRKDLIGTLMEGLDDVVKDAKTYMITYSVVLVVVTVVNVVFLIL